MSEQPKINQYLSFSLDKTLYAINVERIQSVLEVPEIIKVPNTPDYMSGIINLRGNVVPVIDLKLKFGLDKSIITVDTTIIVLEIILEDEQIIMGVLADEVYEVIDISTDNIEPAPRIGTNINIEFIEGMGKKEEQFLILLNIDKIFSYIEMEQATSVQETAQEAQNESPNEKTE